MATRDPAETLAGQPGGPPTSTSQAAGPHLGPPQALAEVQLTGKGLESKQKRLKTWSVRPRKPRI